LPDLQKLQKHYTAFQFFYKGKQKANISISIEYNNNETLYQRLVSGLVNSKKIIFINFPKNILNLAVDKLTASIALGKNWADITTTAGNKVQDVVMGNTLQDIKNIVLHIKNESTCELRSEYKFCNSCEVCALDISMQSTGVAALCEIDGQSSILLGKIKSSADLDDISRGWRAAEELRRVTMLSISTGEKFIVDVTRAASLVVEGGALGAIQGAYRIGRFSGAVLSAFSNKTVPMEVSPTRLKLVTTGKGRAEKFQMIAAARAHYNIPDSISISDDEADALSLLRYKISQPELDRGFPIKSKKTKRRKKCQ